MRLTRFRIVTLAFLLAVGAFAAAGLMLHHEPAFYRRVAVAAGPQREEMSSHFLATDFINFYNNFTDGSGGWKTTFTQDQLNSYFEEHFKKFKDADDFREIGITNIRLEFTDDHIHLGFRYAIGAWSTILSYDLKVWLVSSEMNVLAVEIVRRRAGAIPIPTQHVFQELKDIARQKNIDIEWYRHNGNPVAIVKFQCDRPRPTAHLRRLEIGAGRLELQGLSLSFDPVRNSLEEPIKQEAVKAP